MDLSKLTMGNGSFGLIMPIMVLLFFSAVAGGIVLALGRSRKTLWTVVIATVILVICGYCLFLACNSVRHAKKTVMVYVVSPESC